MQPKYLHGRNEHVYLIKAILKRVAVISAKKHKALIRNRQTRKVANAKVHNRNTNLTYPNLTQPNLT